MVTIVVESVVDRDTDNQWHLLTKSIPSLTDYHRVLPSIVLDFQELNILCKVIDAKYRCRPAVSGK